MKKNPFRIRLSADISPTQIYFACAVIYKDSSGKYPHNRKGILTFCRDEVSAHGVDGFLRGEDAHSYIEEDICDDRDDYLNTMNMARWMAVQYFPELKAYEKDFSI